MNEKRLREILLGIREKKLNIDEAVEGLKRLPFYDLGFAKIDSHRELRRGFPEVVYCAGKTTEQVVTIVRDMAEKTDHNILATRAGREVYEAVAAEVAGAEYHDIARFIIIRHGSQEKRGCIVVLSAGTSDMPVAEEAALTAEAMGNRVERVYDVGVAGIHRLFNYRDKLLVARVLIAVAGMEGALPSVVAGLVDKPVIAVPTSVGYGASFGGLAALLAMLNSCASGVSVVNIDNGFGAGYQASLINSLENSPV
ncbi:MAG: 1-(5-phosphoribosyl)-5-amino-4-imidazole-carboxylate carboxylase [Syntrophaceae bacterium CG2_30_49_12]|nr:MAG: 1-(5-phosphoribosyl)-5-amino-4-imidazole-carboxylate carboxylase [Syntrophaceae bacterium CG2_30_49_12]PIP07247.1 MAG: 1-(5-phosphoribosyl)-5-amino-4-imidazole-carboxylate carboxylase [Syntrophobacterales bacterium CG23_combo_of_CG06-09_8_20_14_all_48_27]PJA50092.1 MAG: 1-(5-phosphoribosyl)-5-amino-4-imidazole-carboxylate carboxylase [Syntrophobacterales bacterium CG_4_9_14_3_um_filter_49_8]PJC73120.1 MAG: 1-(5-phosphoribosyl)-5-amino-4-imidazole-carboxylate carboxylase [Syntrophobactera